MCLKESLEFQGVLFIYNTYQLDVQLLWCCKLWGIDPKMTCKVVLILTTPGLVLLMERKV